MAQREEEGTFKTCATVGVPVRPLPLTMLLRKGIHQRKIVKTVTSCPRKLLRRVMKCKLTKCQRKKFNLLKNQNRGDLKKGMSQKQNV